MATRLLAFGRALVPLLSVAALSAAGAALTRTPYLQLVDTDSALVAFRTDSSCAASVRYGTGGNTDQVATAQGTGTRHAVQLSSLQAGTEYTYQVEACGQLLDKPRRFRTATPPTTQSVHFTAVGDQGTGGNAQIKVGQNMHRARPELWLTLGDNAYDNGTEEQFQTRFFSPLADLLAEVPTFASLGNHEYYTSSGQPHLDNFYLPANNPEKTERYYSFDWGHVHFVALDSSCGWVPPCDMAKQQAWLRDDLANSRQPWKVVFFHHPPWSSGYHGNIVKVRDAFVPILEQHDVDLVLTGHDHNYERIKPMRGTEVDPENGIPYLVVGSGGAGLRSWPGSQPSWSAFRDATVHGHLDVRVQGGTMDLKWVDINGEVRDSLTLSKPVAPPQPGEVAPRAEPQAGEAPLETTLSAATSIAGARFSWDFGDGQSGEGASVSHTYQSPGAYTATVTATGSNGEVATGTVAIRAGEPGCESAGTCPPPEGTTPGAAGCSVTPALIPLAVAGLAVATALRRRRRR